MASQHVFECENCNAQERHHLCSGTNPDELNKMLGEIVHKGERNTIRSLLRYDGPVKTRYGHRLYSCPECKTLGSRLFVLVLHGYEEKGAKDVSVFGETFHDTRFRKVYRSRFECPRCDHDSVRARDGWSACRCKSCGGQGLIKTA
jgi:hypothetical protein